MPAPRHDVVEALADAARVLPTQPNPDEIARFRPSFLAAAKLLAEEADPARRQQWLEQAEALVPREGGARVLFLSLLLSATGAPHYLTALYETVWNGPFTLQQKHFFYWQLLVRHGNVQKPPALEPRALYASLLAAWRAALRVQSPWIPPHERRLDHVVVITNQMLGLQHAPTADCLDYCHILQTHLKMQVFLINTGDMPWTVPLPWHEPVRFNHVQEHDSLSKLQVRDTTVSFYQCRAPMPTPHEVEFVVRKVLAIRPGVVLSLGHSNVTPDLCSDFLTVVTMPFGTNLPVARSNLFVLPRALRSDDEAAMASMGISGERVIQAPYTFRLPERSESLTRDELGLPDDAYVLAVVGIRLDQEVTAQFVVDLERLLTAVPRLVVAFMGMFRSFDQLVSRSELMKRRSRFLGLREDLVAAYECCDGYLNPPRYGGGSSAAFALASGLPVFTCTAGDVANIVGPRFMFPGIDAIAEFIQRTLRDRAFRNEWAQVARDRFADVSDRQGMLRHIVEQARAKSDLRSLP